MTNNLEPVELFFIPLELKHFTLTLSFDILLCYVKKAVDIIHIIILYGKCQPTLDYWI